MASLIVVSGLNPAALGPQTPIAATPSPSVQTASVEATLAQNDLGATDQSNDTTEISSEIRTAAVQNGVDPDLAVSIARCESHLRQFDTDGQVLRGEVNPADVGLFQINELYHLKKSQGLGLDIYSSDGNIQYAMHLLKTEGSKPWIWSRPCWNGAQA